MPKTKRLTVRELRSIAKELKNADLDVVQQVVIREVQKEQHVHFFQDRKALWCYLIGDSCVAFREVLKDGIDKFCFLYVDQCSKGADRHLRLLLAWNDYGATYAVASMSTPASSRRWSRLLSGYAGAVSDDCRSAVMSVIFSALFTYIVRQRDLILDNLSSRCESAIRKEPAAPVTPDDDVSLYRLFGFSLHISIQYRSRSCWNRSRVAKRYTLEKKLKLRKQLSMLKVLVESDKSHSRNTEETGPRTDEVSTSSSVAILSCMFCEDKINTEYAGSPEGWSQDIQGNIMYIHMYEHSNPG